MENTNFKYYKIDLADIWEYEREKFIAGDTNESLAQKIIDLIRLYVIKNGEPSFGEEMVHKNSEYYGRKVFDYLDADLRMKYALDYFFYKSDCYEYSQSMVISENEKDFNFFFALKLRQYNDNLFEVQNFLRNHFVNSFVDGAKSCIKYLNISLFQYDYLFSEGLKTQVHEFISTLESQNILQSTDYVVKDNNPSDKLNEFNSNENIVIDNQLNDEKQEKRMQVVKSIRNDLVGKNNEVTGANTKIWAGTDAQLVIFYNIANDELFDGVSKDEFFNHFTGKGFQNKINWFAGNNAFIELFDKLATKKLINRQFVKQNNEFKDRLVILTSKINRHFVFNGNEKKAANLIKSRYQFHQSKGKSNKHEIILELINKLSESQQSSLC